MEYIGDKKIMNDVITLPDGYNGNTIDLLSKPFDCSETCVKLRVVGSNYLFRWVDVDVWRKLVGADLASANLTSANLSRANLAGANH